MSEYKVVVIDAAIKLLKENPLTCVGCIGNSWTNASMCKYLVEKELCQKQVFVRLVESGKIIVDP